MKKILTTAVLAVTLGATLAACGGDDALSQGDRDKATNAALAATGGGSVTDTLKKASDAAIKAAGGGKVTETGGSDDDDHVYEVDVLLENGEDVTVELDGAFKVTKIDR